MSLKLKAKDKPTAKDGRGATHGRVAIIDADPLVYRIGFACQKTIHTKDGVDFRNKTDMKEILGEDAEADSTRVEVEDKSHAFHSVNLIIDTILEETSSSRYELYLTGEDNFRKELAVTAEYKGNRNKLHKPVLYDEIRNFLINRHNAIVIDGMEADDMCSIRHTQEKDCVICSTDKDLDMLPGLHYNYAKARLYMVECKEGMLNFYSQILTGDTTDNIKGIYGIGKKKAQALLAGCETEEDCFHVVMQAYNDHYGEEKGIERLSETAALLWMLREEKELWTPELVGKYYE